MLILEPINYGEAVILYGSGARFRKLYATIHALADALPAGHDEFVLGLAFDVRHAYEGRAERKCFSVAKFRHRKRWLLGVEIPWMIMLQHLMLLKYAARLIRASEHHQNILIELESATMAALLCEVPGVIRERRQREVIKSPFMR